MFSRDYRANRGQGEDEKKEEEYLPIPRREMAPHPTVGGTKGNNSSSSNVQFSQLQIREYPIEIGDNPGAASGPSLSIGWSHFSEVELSIDEYESQRPHRRFRLEMLVPPDTRFERLRSAGFSRKEIMSATRPVNIIRQQRRRTRETLQLQPLYEMNEKVGRKAIQLLTMGKRKKEEKDLLNRSNHGSGRTILRSSSALLDQSETQSSFRLDCPEVSLIPNPDVVSKPDIAYASSDDRSEMSC